MNRATKLGTRVLIVLVMILSGSSSALAIIDVCIWYSNGCFTTVFQYSWGFWDIGWEMFVSCYFPYDGGYWWGWGLWGGICQGISFPLL